MDLGNISNRIAVVVTLMAMKELRLASHSTGLYSFPDHYSLDHHVTGSHK
jgi:hypothetical protein